MHAYTMKFIVCACATISDKYRNLAIRLEILFCRKLRSKSVMFTSDLKRVVKMC